MIKRWQAYGQTYGQTYEQTYGQAYGQAYGQTSRIVLGSLLGIMTVSLWSCRPAPPPEPELPTVTLKPVEVVPELESVHCAIASDSPSLALMYVASELGYFEEEGLELSITKVTPSSAPKQLPLLNLLLQEDIDCVAQTLDGYLRTQDGQVFPTAVIASLYRSTGADGLVVTGSIGSIEDLLDQPMGGDRHHPGMLLTYRALQELGYRPDDFVMKPIAPEWTGQYEEPNDTAQPEVETNETNETDQTEVESNESNETAQTDVDPGPLDSGDSETAIADETPIVRPRPSYASIFSQERVVAIAASEPILSHISNDTGGRILITSSEFDDLLMGMLIVERSNLDADSDRYRGLLRGMYQAIALSNSDRSLFLQTAAPYYGQSPQTLEETLQGISYTPYSDLQRIIGAGASTGTLFQTFTDLNAIHQDLDLQNGPLFYDDHIDNRLIPNLFDP